MFTGIIEHRGRVETIQPTATGLRLSVDPQGWPKAHAAGDSICVSGCCLTLVAEPTTHSGRLVFDLIPETLNRTTLGTFAPGRDVNLEQAATMGTLMGGHVVQGHVDGLGRVLSVQNSQAVGSSIDPSSPGAAWLGAAQCRLRIRPSPGLIQYAVPKGSVAIDGVSLTIAAIDVGEGWFEVALIPVTLARTTLHAIRPGNDVNLEMDALAKTVVHYLRHYLRDGGIGSPVG